MPELSKRLKKSLEETGRLFRYKLLKKITREANGYITTGHHIDDYIETVFINLIRGGGYSSLNAIPIYKDGIFRPLLVFTELEMNSILKEEGWNVFEDESNDSDKFLRNRIRKKILPFLKEEGMNTNKVYENFHNTEEILLDLGESVNEKQIASYLRIDSLSLSKINLGNLKQILDVYASLLKIHPFTRSILLEVKKELEKQTSFLIENREVILSKSSKSDLFLIPKNSNTLKEAVFETSEDKQILHWNGNSKEVSIEFKIGSYTNGLKIAKNGKHFAISEILREKQIPIPVREFIPILFKENQASIILFSLWDDRMRDFIGDLFYEHR
ncbi:MAG: tRNA lysidine(34) synthetase TilS [Leptospiraceae bacterium]|nr:tRNA lysidine(34) synthetase TilS [Leptospiraceae bacterium]MBK7056476.1 tRNA lysidine(34) synthetase TilS [Leptospiraceae bacterium]MBP9163235.1 tRNA lysidine(34) synthetase TilS [Leptospiraceae bacterium]